MRRRPRTRRALPASPEAPCQPRISPRTGRTHQIRVHLASEGCPVLADKVYSGRDSLRLSDLEPDTTPEQDEVLMPRQALHAAYLAFRHPATGEPLEFEAGWPADLEPLLAAALGPGNPVVNSDPLRYLRFFKAHG